MLLRLRPEDPPALVLFAPNNRPDRLLRTDSLLGAAKLLVRPGTLPEEQVGALAVERPDGFALPFVELLVVLGAKADL